MAIQPGLQIDAESISSDDRWQVSTTDYAPPLHVCFLYLQTDSLSGVGSYATGWLASPNVVITAGHHLYNPIRKTWTQQFNIIPGRNGNQFPLGSRSLRYSASQVKVAPGWLKNDRDYDIGALILPPDQGFALTSPPLHYTAAPENGPPLSRVVLPGYPNDKPLGTMWASAGHVEKREQHLMRYKIDVARGQSGAPLIAMRDPQRWENTVYGMHLAEQSMPQMHLGLCFTPEIIALIRDWTGQAV